MRLLACWLLITLTTLLGLRGVLCLSAGTGLVKRTIPPSSSPEQGGGRMQDDNTPVEQSQQHRPNEISKTPKAPGQQPGKLDGGLRREQGQTQSR